MRLYIDGVLVDSLPVAITVEGPAAFAIGGTDSAEYPFHGSIDEVLVHSVAKSPDYIYKRAHPGIPMVDSSNPLSNKPGIGNEMTYSVRGISIPHSQIIPEQWRHGSDCR